ncbi:MAG: hypothetical protein ACMG57_04760, partial [Candidatus Dojkabacteria bacterium]
ANFALILIAVFGVILVGILLRGIGKVKIKTLVLSLLGLTAVVAAAFVFPFRDYYKVSRIPFEMIVQIFIVSIIAFAAIFAIGKFTNRYLSKNP